MQSSISTLTKDPRTGFFSGNAEEHFAVDIRGVHGGAAEPAFRVSVKALYQHLQGLADQALALLFHNFHLVLHDDFGAALFHILVDLVRQLCGGCVLLLRVREQPSRSNLTSLQIPSIP